MDHIKVTPSRPTEAGAGSSAASLESAAAASTRTNEFSAFREGPDALHDAGSPARSGRAAAPPADPDPSAAAAGWSCCVGEDAPGVGRVHSADCPQHRVVLPGSPYIPGVVPETLRAYVEGDAYHLRFSPAEWAEMKRVERAQEERDRLLGELLFAARDLSQSQFLRLLLCWKRVRLVSIPLNRIELPVSGLCFTFRGRLIRWLLVSMVSMAVVQSLSGGRLL